MKYRAFLFTAIAFIVLMSLCTYTLYAQSAGQTTTFEELGISLKTDQPEGAVLAFALPDVYILPDSKLYWIVKLWESIRYIVEESPEERASMLLEFSKRRLSEGFELLNQNKLHDAGEAIAVYATQLREALGVVQSLPNSTERQGMYDLLYEQLWYQQAFAKVVEAEGQSEVLSGLESELKSLSQTGSLELSHGPE